MTLPDRFIGAWKRTELIVDGEVVENGPTLWLEAGTAFVDVRGPGGFASDMTFAGTTAWTEPHLRWTHEIESEDGGEDVGLITPDGDDLIESGEFTTDRVITFSERWSPQPRGSGPVAVAATDGGLAVRVGDHASAVLDRRATSGGIAGRYQRWDGSRWVTEITHGTDTDLAALPAPLDPTGPPPDGWTWRD
jgi:Protein HRI1